MTDATTPQDLDDILAADDAAPRIVSPGEEVYCVAHGLTISTSTGGVLGGRFVTLRPGQTFVVTAAMIEASRDRHGRIGWPAWVHDEAEQVRRWGKVMLRPGRPAEDFVPWRFGSEEWAEARETARRRAWAQDSPAEQRAALAEVERVYGPGRKTSFTTNKQRYGTPSEHAASEQAEAFARARAEGKR
ncbi:hypothetical protein [Microbacterium sp. NPDC055357]